MDRKELGLQFTDAQNFTVYGTIPKDITRDLFDGRGVIPTNDLGEADDSYICGEVQFMFNEESGTLDEILIFPVYSYEDTLVNGEDFIAAPDWFRDFEDDARQELYFNMEDTKDGR